MKLVKYENSMLFSSNPDLGANNVSVDGSTFEVNFTPALFLPKNAVNVSICAEESTVWYVCPNITEANNKFYIYGNSNTNIPTLYTVTIAKGLYDLTALSGSILSQLSDQGAQTVPTPLVNFLGDGNTQKVIIRFNYNNVYVDFTRNNTFREILGFSPLVYGPYANSPLNVYATNTAKFNTVNYFLIACNLVNQGIRFNNRYANIISQVLIDVPPGSQIVSKPYNPSRVDANNLIGASRTNVKFSLTNDRLQAVDTNGEYYSVRLVLRYSIPTDV